MLGKSAPLERRLVTFPINIWQVLSQLILFIRYSQIFADLTTPHTPTWTQSHPEVSLILYWNHRSLGVEIATDSLLPSWLKSCMYGWQYINYHTAFHGQVQPKEISKVMVSYRRLWSFISPVCQSIYSLHPHTLWMWARRWNLKRARESWKGPRWRPWLLGSQESTGHNRDFSTRHWLHSATCR